MKIEVELLFDVDVKSVYEYEYYTEKDVKDRIVEDIMLMASDVLSNADMTIIINSIEEMRDEM